METLVVTLTLSTVVALLALVVGVVIGWVARQHSYETTPQNIYSHPEMFDANGNIIPDEIVAVRFEQHDNNEENEEDI
tara:strand:- start:268 stop:501 length:234 start_codon:yes stop_codon:yes gene_type:complete